MFWELLVATIDDFLFFGCDFDLEEEEEEVRDCKQLRVGFQEEEEEDDEVRDCKQLRDADLEEEEDKEEGEEEVRGCKELRIPPVRKGK